MGTLGMIAFTVLCVLAVLGAAVIAGFVASLFDWRDEGDDQR